MKRTPLKRKTPLKSGKGIRRSKVDKVLPWEIAHLEAVKHLRCCACGAGAPNQAHHCHHDRATKFGGRKAPHRWTIPLCGSCHTDGPHAIHRIKRTWREIHGADWEHVPAVMTAIYGTADPSDDEIEAHWKNQGII